MNAKFIGLVLFSGFLFEFSSSQDSDKCPRPDEIAPCQCRTRGPSIQVRCTNTMMGRITEAMTNIRKKVESVDVLILEGNTIPHLPSRAFGSVKVNRLFIENNRLHTIDRNAFAGIEYFLTELYIKEPQLKSFPPESVDYLRNLEVFSIENSKIIDIPRVAGLRNLKLFKLDGSNVRNLNSQSLKNLPSLKYLHVSRSNVRRIEVGLLGGLRSLVLANFSDNAISWIHPRALRHLDHLIEVHLKGNAIKDAGMVGRAVRPVKSLERLDVSHNLLTDISQGSFSAISRLKYLDLSHNNILDLHKSAFESLTSLNVVDMSHNRIDRFRSDTFRETQGVEKLFLKHNKIRSLSDVSFLADALPNLRYLDLSENEIRDIPFGAMRGYPKLERLFLSQNQIARVSSEALADMPSLNELDLSNNKLIGDLIDAPIFGLRNLKVLKLSFNKLSKVNEKILQNLPDLRRLDLSNNGITLIEEEAFQGLSNLDYLNISYNNIKELDLGVFKDMRRLYELDASNNELVSLNEDLLVDQELLEYVSFSSNQLQSVPFTLFPFKNRIRYLDLTSNFIRDFPDRLVSKCKNLRKLLFKRNSLAKLSENSFRGLSHLEMVSLHDNRIEEISEGTFKDLRSLKILDLSLNIISTVGDTLDPLSSLMKLNLSDNYITVLPQKAFHSLRRLSTLDISNNTVMEIKEAFSDMPALKYLDLSYNHLPYIKKGTFSDLPSLSSLRLNHNSIIDILPGAFNRLWKLERISFTKNGIQMLKSQTFTDLPSLELLELDDNLIGLMEDDSFRDLYSLKELRLEKNLIQKINERAFQRIPSIRYLNLSYNLIENLPRSGFLGLETLETIDLSFNDIRRIDDRVFENMKWLSKLYMNDNNICTVGRSAFTDASSLSNLNLKNNRLSRVDGESFAPLKQQMVDLRIAGNPLTCDCNTLWLRNWITEGNVVRDQPRCYFPKALSGSQLKILRTSRFTCQRSSEEKENEAIIKDACLGIPLKPPVRQALQQKIQSSPSTTESTVSSARPTKVTPEVEEEPDFDDSPSENGNEEYEYYYIYYDENGKVTQNLSDFPVPVSKPVISKVQEINLIHNSDDLKPGDTPTIYAASNNKQGLVQNILPLTTVSPKTTTSAGLTFFGIPLPSLPKLPPVSLSFDLKPTQLGNSFLLPVGRKGDASKGSSIDHTRGPDNIEDPIWIDSSTRVKKESLFSDYFSTTVRTKELQYALPSNPMIPLHSEKMYYPGQKIPAIKFDHPSQKKLPEAFQRPVIPLPSMQRPETQIDSMRFAASQDINGFRPLFKPHSSDPIYMPKKSTTSATLIEKFRTTSTIRTTTGRSTTSLPSKASSVSPKKQFAFPAVPIETVRSSNNVAADVKTTLSPSKNEASIAITTESSSKTKNLEIKDTVSKAFPEFKVTATPVPTLSIQEIFLNKTKETTTETPEEIEYEYYYEYYEDEEDIEPSTTISPPTVPEPEPTKFVFKTTSPAPAPSKRLTTTITPRTTTKSLPVFTSTLVSYVDGNHNFDQRKSLASVETGKGVLSRSKGIPPSSSSTSTTTSYPFHPDSFDPTARIPLNPDDPETEAINWYFNGEDKNPYVDPKLLEKIEQHNSSGHNLIPSLLTLLSVTTLLSPFR